MCHDVSTAFLQGLPQERLLWVKLPAECVRLLGADDSCRMKLYKPCYGQLDAPRRWWLEACRRLKSLNLRQHILDPCCFLIFEEDFPEIKALESNSSFGESGLVGMIGLHVDDMLGCGCQESLVYQHVIKQLKETFSFREWKDGDSLEYCGATMQKSDAGVFLHHEAYLKKIKPISLPKTVGPESELSHREISALRGLLGSLQWPAVQSSPHLQASASMFSGAVTKGLAKTVFECNKLLKFAKENSDVGLNFPCLGDPNELQIITPFDASFCSRDDGTSQGGFLVLLAPRRVLETDEDQYHILDWKSFRLPRIARSSLSAEAQAAGSASGATEFCCRYLQHLKQPNLTLADLLKTPCSWSPTLITDAKALYDSYHRESLVSSVTDRRSSLEIRVVKEQIQSLNGSLRWVSSDRQLADGLTKASMRQALADKIRHGKVKFLYDPQYVAAKKKSLAERKKELEETSKTRRSMHRTPRDDEIPDEVYDLEPNDVPDTNEALDTNEVPAEVCFAQNAQVVRYVNASSHVGPEYDMTVLVKYVFKTLALFWFWEQLPKAAGTGVEFCSTDAVSGSAESNNNLTWSFLRWFSLVAILAVMLLALTCRRRIGRLKNALDSKQIEVNLLQDDLAAARHQLVPLQSTWINCNRLTTVEA